VLIAAGELLMLRSVEGWAASLAVVVAASAVMLYILFMLLKWFVYNVKISPGPALSFTGSFISLLGWSLLVAILVCTVVGWAWAQAAMYRWMAENLKGRGMRFEFHGKGHELLWRKLATVLGSDILVTLPWLYIWLVRWLAQNVTMTHVEENEWLSEPSSEARRKPKPSSQGPHSPVLPID